MKKKVVILLLCTVAVLSTKYFSSPKAERSALLLYNVEALASDDEDIGISRCYGTGTLDCPVSHEKVEYIFRGYSLEK